MAQGGLTRSYLQIILKQRLLKIRQIKEKKILT